LRKDLNKAGLHEEKQGQEGSTVQYMEIWGPEKEEGMRRTGEKWKRAERFTGLKMLNVETEMRNPNPSKRYCGRSSVRTED
jgi:hypothetical protein